ncbi:glutamate--tRNA ligase [Pullulanibacillus sp. KACC 23026]|uniref:glutamate--tRNA ligase n=1 Tax=Pullulanibacillus sp. KACC 23026 TaxID=3028315 RepID=UPI0023AEB17E|nr:glutamate--tRNA ligase [Pullulanibacillus sp. KACC 23026]WEG12694.1 glutamate--tRNA ligase [Pullulanibacillus sp. KACC 23026]
MSEKIRVRYAPSPTGHLHIGNARTALFNYLFARSQNGSFIVRIEDTDVKRNVEGGEENQLNYLKWLGMDWDESIDVGGDYGPYRQLERLDIYETYSKQLLENGQAYKCYCTEEELAASREAQLARGEAPKYDGHCRHLTEEDHKRLEAEGRKPSVRFKVPAGKVYSFDDIVKKQVTFESDGIGDFVIVKKDGIPTYNYAVTIDDHLMAMTHVLRGEDHISNTPKQMMIYEAFGWEPPVFGHMTLIVNENRKKLSKRDESIVQFIEQYHELGYLPEALFNFITLLGWSPQGEEELFTREEFIKIFDPNRLSTSPAVFDPKKLAWVNNQYIKKASLETVIELAMPHLIKAGRLPEGYSKKQEQWAHKLIALYKEQLQYGAEIVELTELFFKEDISYNEEELNVLKEEQVPEVLAAFLEHLTALENWQADEIKAQIKATQKATGQKGKKLFMPIRIATTGQAHGPELPDSIELLGKEVVTKRLEKALELLK